MADRVSSQRSKWAVAELAAAPLALPLPLTCRREDVKLEHCCRSYHFNLDLRKDELSCCYSILNAYSGQCCLWHFGSRSDVSTARPPHPCHFTALAVSSLLKCSRGMQIVSLNRHGTVTDGEDASQTEIFSDSTSVFGLGMDRRSSGDARLLISLESDIMLLTIRIRITPTALRCRRPSLDQVFLGRGQEAST